MKHIISLGAGVQSSTMALMAAHGEITPMPDCAIFADTQAEPQSVYTWLDWLEGQLPFPVIRVTAGSLADNVTLMRRTKDGRLFSQTNIPFFTKNADNSQGRIKYRSCTKDYKITPIIREVRNIVGIDVLRQWRKDHRPELRIIAAYQRALSAAKKDKKTALPAFPHDAWASCQNDALITQWIGISTDEATRMKPSREAWIKCVWPLIDARQSRTDCINWMRDNEYPEPPRSSCVFCPFHNDNEWRRLRDTEPAEFQKAVEFEIKVQEAKRNSDNFRTVPYLHRSLVALEAVDLSTAEDRGQINLFENECEGMCGV
jgi:hypothetical protein